MLLKLSEVVCACMDFDTGMSKQFYCTHHSKMQVGIWDCSAPFYFFHQCQKKELAELVGRVYAEQLGSLHCFLPVTAPKLMCFSRDHCAFKSEFFSQLKGKMSVLVSATHVLA